MNRDRRLTAITTRSTGREGQGGMRGYVMAVRGIGAGWALCGVVGVAIGELGGGAWVSCCLWVCLLYFGTVFACCGWFGWW